MLKKWSYKTNFRFSLAHESLWILIPPHEEDYEKTDFLDKELVYVSINLQNSIKFVSLWKFTTIGKSTWKLSSYIIYFSDPAIHALHYYIYERFKSESSFLWNCPHGRPTSHSQSRYTAMKEPPGHVLVLFP